MICDGMSRHATISSEVSVWFRPVTSTERAFFRHATQRISNHTAIVARYRFVSEHLVCGMNDIESKWPSVQQFALHNPEQFEVLWRVVQGLIPDSSGRHWVEDEPLWRKNLWDGILLLRTNPRIAKRSCVDCKTYWYSEETMLPIVSQSTGLRMLRVGPTMCESPEGCPKGTPENQKNLNPANTHAVRHYMECVSIGHFPQDAIVAANAKIIAKALAKKLK